ncbi:MAG TPA: hypothetical protein VLA17_01660 [Candidatus Limnocylindria bacterium]|nr:hypothetical protein [Candidatus Limnocylindria bacterium]
MLSALGFSCFAAACGPTLQNPLPCDLVQVISNELSPSEAQEYCRYASGERQKVERFWGATWREPIRIHVSKSYRITRALVPGYFGNRGFIEMPLRRVRDHTGALLHEIVHVYAPHNNRFLAEGLAVYLHARFAGNPAFPNFSEDLRRSAARRLTTVPSLKILNAVRTPRPLSTVMNEETAYTVAGSFVRFLIENYGLESFRKVYESEDYDKVYAKSLDLLETEWRRSLR